MTPCTTLLERYPILFLCENLVNFNEARLHKATLNPHTRAWIFFPPVNTVSWWQAAFERDRVYCPRRIFIIRRMTGSSNAACHKLTLLTGGKKLRMRMTIHGRLLQAHFIEIHQVFEKKGIYVITIKSKKFIFVATSWLVLSDCEWGSRLPDMEDSCEYNEQIVVVSRSGLVFLLGGLTWS